MGLELPPRVRRLGRWTAVSAGLLLMSACSQADQDQIGRLGMPEGATDRAPYIFDLADNGVVIFGPAARALPQLPLMLDDEGYLVAQSDFTEPVGPSYWERG